MRRPRGVSRAPLAVAGILATLLFFVSLMVFSLALEEPTVVAGELADPSRANDREIWLTSLIPSAVVVVAGILGMFVRSPFGVVISAGSAIVTTIVLRIPLATWESEHTRRFPDGVDLIPRDDPSDAFLRGEWEQTAAVTARQMGFWTIVLAAAAIAIAVALDLRRRRGIAPPPTPAPPEGITAESEVVRRGFGLRRSGSRDATKAGETSAGG